MLDVKVKKGQTCFCEAKLCQRRLFGITGGLQELKVYRGFGFGRVLLLPTGSFFSDIWRQVDLLHGQLVPGRPEDAFGGRQDRGLQAVEPGVLQKLEEAVLVLEQTT